MGAYWSFNDSEEETQDKHVGKVASLVGEEGDNRPGDHEPSHVQRGPDFGKDHIGRDLAGNVSNEEDRDERLELIVLEPEIDIHTVQSTVGDGISVEEVEEVHDPEKWPWQRQLPPADIGEICWEACGYLRG